MVGKFIRENKNRTAIDHCEFSLWMLPCYRPLVNKCSLNEFYRLSGNNDEKTFHNCYREQHLQARNRAADKIDSCLKSLQYTISSFDRDTSCPAIIP